MKRLFSFYVLILLSTHLNAQRTQQTQIPITAVTKEDIQNLPRQSIQDLMPKRTLGVAAGVGFNNDFEEIGLCLSGEALFRLNEPDPCGFYLGGDATIDYTSFNDWKQTTFEIGPKAQFHTPITPSQEVQWVNGIGAKYLFGNIDSNGFKEDLSGFNATLYSGLNIRLTEKLSIGLEIPLLGYENLTYKSDYGEDFKDNNTSLLINKRNPVKIGTRFRF